jgi:putative transposase
MTYQFIEQHKQEFPVVVMCGVLAVSESGFYAWRKRSACRREREDAQLAQKIRRVFISHQGRYGSPRILRELHDEVLSELRSAFGREATRGICLWEGNM